MEDCGTNGVCSRVFHPVALRQMIKYMLDNCSIKSVIFQKLLGNSAILFYVLITNVFKYDLLELQHYNTNGTFTGIFHSLTLKQLIKYMLGSFPTKVLIF